MRTVVFPSRLAMVVHAVSAFQFLGFSAAERYARRFPDLIALEQEEYFVTERRKRALALAKKKGKVMRDHSAGTMHKKTGIPEGETVGAVVCDGFGNVACVTSTGGLTGKMDGRIGDTPLIGAGSYADNRSCAVSGTGIGEEFLRLSAASRVCFAMEYGGVSMKDAMSNVIHGEFPEDTGGFIACSPAGEVITDMNSTGMFRGCQDWHGKRVVKIWED